MSTLVAMFLLLPIVGFAEEVRITVGQSYGGVLALIQKHGATDVTPGLAVVGPKVEHPLKGIYWEFRDYDAIITLTAENGKVTAMTFWTKKDFGDSKSHRAQTEQSIKTLKLDTQTRGVSIEKKKDGG